MLGDAECQAVLKGVMFASAVLLRFFQGPQQLPAAFEVNPKHLVATEPAPGQNLHTGLNNTAWSLDVPGNDASDEHGSAVRRRNGLEMGVVLDQGGGTASSEQCSLYGITSWKFDRILRYD